MSSLWSSEHSSCEVLFLLWKTIRTCFNITSSSRVFYSYIMYLSRRRKTYEPEKVSRKINWKVVIISVLVLILATTGAQYYLNHSDNIKWADGNSSTSEEMTSVIKLKRQQKLNNILIYLMMELSQPMITISSCQNLTVNW